MKYLIAISLCILLGAGAWASDVTRVELSHQADATVATIWVDGQLRFTHQTEVPKNGAGHRIIVDILSAVHQLPSKNYSELPSCVVKSIRSSQFSVTPEKVVRVVFDMADVPVYQISSDDHSIIITMADKSAKPFATWSSNGWKPAPEVGKPPVQAKAEPKSAPQTKTAAEKNKTIEADRLASLTPSKPASKGSATKSIEHASANDTKPVEKAQPKAEPKKAASKVSTPQQNATPKKSPAKPAQADQPEARPEPKAKVEQKKAPSPVKPKTSSSSYAKMDNPWEANYSEMWQAPAKQTTPQVAQAQPEPPAKQLASTEPKADSKSTSESKPKAEPAKDKPAPVKQAPVKQAPAGQTEQQKFAAKVTGKNASEAATSKPAKPEVKPQAKSEPPKAKTESPKAEAKKQVAAAEEQPKATRKTARFRRDAENSARFKGTMVAEFPQRLVIKYQDKGRRDPFAALIDQDRSYDSPVEERVPNIDGLKLVGVIESSDAPNRALFEDSEGYSYILKSGDKVRKGYVLRVESEKVFFQIFEYGWSRTVALTME